MRVIATAEAQTAYLFQCKNDSAFFAVSRDPSAANIPFGTPWYGGWSLCNAFALDRHPPLAGRALVDVDPTPMLRGVLSFGYYIWRNGAV